MVEGGNDDQLTHQPLIIRVLRWRSKRPSWPEGSIDLLFRRRREALPTTVWMRVRLFRVAMWASFVALIGLGSAGLLSAIGPASGGITERLLLRGETILVVLPGLVLLQFIIPWLARYRVREILRAARDSGYKVCSECGYLLHGLADDGDCPECGVGYARDELRRLWEHVA